MLTTEEKLELIQAVVGNSPNVEINSQIELLQKENCQLKEEKYFLQSSIDRMTLTLIYLQSAVLSLNLNLDKNTKHEMHCYIWLILEKIREAISKEKIPQDDFQELFYSAIRDFELDIKARND